MPGIASLLALTLSVFGAQASADEGGVTVLARATAPSSGAESSAPRSATRTPPTRSNGVAVAAFGDAPAVPEPDGYRLDDYDAPVPEGLRGARTVTAVDVRAMLAADADVVVVDVIPAHRPPPALPEGQLWLPLSHAGVPGALWLPDTGFGSLDPLTERYLLEHLERATDGDLARDLVFYCRMDCWMSWNAAKRALAVGYERVHWFRDGIDDWRFEGYATAPLEPAPGERLPPPDARGEVDTAPREGSTTDAR